MVTKRLVFHFYADESWRDNVANECHFRCLDHFSSIFDEALIVISLKNGGNINENDIKKRFVDVIKAKTLSFKVVENTPYYEAETFKNEIIDKARELDGITFFAHNKGVSNVFDKDKSLMAVLSWICGLYYYGLSFPEEAEKRLCIDLRTMFYGPYLMQTNYINNRGHVWYAGTFYWVNTNRLVKTCSDIPKIFDREYAEWLPGEVCWGSFLSSHNNLFLPDSDLYRNWMYYAKMSALSDEEYEEFVAFRDSIINGFKTVIYKYTVLTCNFGGYEIMREIRNPQEDVEYIYVTDDPSLKSETWKLVYDMDLNDLSPVEKVQKVRENPFKYCSTAVCVRIDASIEVNGSLDKMMEDFLVSNCDMGIMVHPERDNIFDEYDKWISWRHIDPEEKTRVISALGEMGYNMDTKGLYETGFMVYLNSEYTKRVLEKYSETMKRVGDIRVDQAVFSVVLNNISNVYLWPMSHQCIQSDALRSMEHNSCFTCVVHNIPECGYVKNNWCKLYTI